jgi:hypothetical protein
MITFKKQRKFKPAQATRGKALAARGNALMEYVVPACVILIAAGVIATVGGINEIMAEYFMAASGHTKADLAGNTFETKPMGEGAAATLGNGMAGVSAGGAIYGGAIGRTGGGAPSSEYLYP